MATEESRDVEIGVVIREIQDRVRARYPLNTAGSTQIPLADLMPVVHARDRAEAKVASIGTVNPRPSGFVNDLIQSFKRSVARGLNWFIRDQIEFNRGAMDCVQSLLEAMNETNRAVEALAGHIDRRRAKMDEDIAALRDESAEQGLRLKEEAGRLKEEAQQLNDVRLHWSQWRQEWERKLSVNEIQFLRSVADLQTGFQHRALLMEGNFRELSASYHRDFVASLTQARLEIQERLSADLDKGRTDYEKLIHNELRVMRQRVAGIQPLPGPKVVEAAPAAGGVQLPEPPVDFLRFADRFRGTEDHVRRNQQHYLKRFEGCAEVLDIGCGRGEFLEGLRDSGVLVKGIDSNAEMVAICRSKGLYAEQADLFDYLGEMDESSLDGIFCGQVVEHLPPHRIPELISIAAAALRPGGRIVIETPNPECLAIFATHFYLDPTHQRPVPAQLLAYYLEESGFGRISVEYVNPAEETIPAVRELPEAFRRTFFGGMDYAITATRL